LQRLSLDEKALRTWVAERPPFLFLPAPLRLMIFLKYPQRLRSTAQVLLLLFPSIRPSIGGGRRDLCVGGEQDVGADRLPTGGSAEPGNPDAELEGMENAQALELGHRGRHHLPGHVGELLERGVGDGPRGPAAPQVPVGNDRGATARALLHGPARGCIFPRTSREVAERAIAGMAVGNRSPLEVILVRMNDP
jgi:hypothetical protein